MRENIETLPKRVSLQDILNKIVNTQYQLLPGTTTTICHITLQNGFIILGKSACVDPGEYNQALGEKYAFEDAIDKIWELEGYLLAERRYEAALQ